MIFDKDCLDWINYIFWMIFMVFVQSWLSRDLNHFRFHQKPVEWGCDKHLRTVRLSGFWCYRLSRWWRSLLRWFCQVLKPKVRLSSTKMSQQNVKSGHQNVKYCRKTNHDTICSNFHGQSSSLNICLILIRWRIRMNFESICKWLQLSWTTLFIITQRAIWLAIAQPTSWNTAIVSITVIFILATEI